jgi:hypothetical protein
MLVNILLQGTKVQPPHCLLLNPVSQINFCTCCTLVLQTKHRGTVHHKGTVLRDFSSSSFNSAGRSGLGLELLNANEFLRGHYTYITHVMSQYV